MAYTRTAKGTAKAKTSGTSLSISSVSITAGSALYVGIGYEGDIAPQSVKWGNRLLRRKLLRYNHATGISVAFYLARSINKTATRNLVTTWPSTIGKRALFASVINTVAKVDEESTRQETTGTAQPGTGQTAALNTVADFAVGIFVSEGPSSDAAGTPQIEDADSWQSASAGQRDGTTGAPPVSNITIAETFLELTSVATTRARLQNAGSREWVNAIVCLEPVTYRPDTFGPEGHEIGSSKLFAESKTDIEGIVDSMESDGHVILRLQYILEDPQTGNICYVETIQT